MGITAFVTLTTLPRLLTRFRCAHYSTCNSRPLSCASEPPNSISSSSSPSSSSQSSARSSPLSSPSLPPEATFHLISQKKIFKRHQTVYQRDVRYPNGRVVSFDVLGNERSDFKSVFIFPFDTVTQTVTLIREYSPGRNKEQLSLVAGMFEASKHSTLEDAARAELSEEARLKGGTLIPLSAGIASDKYSLNQFFYFLAVDCVPDLTPNVPDAEEWIHILPGFPLPDIQPLVARGLLNVPNSLCALLALEKLRHMGYDV